MADDVKRCGGMGLADARPCSAEEVAQAGAVGAVGEGTDHEKIRAGLGSGRQGVGVGGKVFGKRDIWENGGAGELVVAAVVGIGDPEMVGAGQELSVGQGGEAEAAAEGEAFDGIDGGEATAEAVGIKIVDIEEEARVLEQLESGGGLEVAGDDEVVGAEIADGVAGGGIGQPSVAVGIEEKGQVARDGAGKKAVEAGGGAGLLEVEFGEDEDAVAMVFEELELVRRGGCGEDEGGVDRAEGAEVVKAEAGALGTAGVGWLGELGGGEEDAGHWGGWRWVAVGTESGSGLFTGGIRIQAAASWSGQERRQSRVASKSAMAEGGRERTFFWGERELATATNKSGNRNGRTIEIFRMS